LLNQVSKLVGLLITGIALIAGCNEAGPGAEPAADPSKTDEPSTTLLPGAATKVEVAAWLGGHVSAVDDSGVPSFLWALDRHPAEPGATPADAARAHLGTFASALGISVQDIAGAEVKAVHHLPSVGVIARLRQRVDGVEVYPSEVRVLMRDNLELVTISGRLMPAEGPPKKRRFAIGEEQALALALETAMGLPVTAADVVDTRESRGDWLVLDVAQSSELHLPEKSIVKPIYFVDDGRVEPAYMIEFYVGTETSQDSRALRFIVSGHDGSVLLERSLTEDNHLPPGVSYTYRVWADASGRPADSPLVDFSPIVPGAPAGFAATSTAPRLVDMVGFNHNPEGDPDGWMPALGTESVGNNVDAYTDHAGPDGFSNGDHRATTTSFRTFDRTYDITEQPDVSLDQSMAAVTQLFYTTNWLHDYWYDSGFNELAGNAQFSNYDRGGVERDEMRAEAQDGYLAGTRNNANMSTPSDGLSPRMQMYAWSGIEDRRLTVSSTTSTATTSFETEGADFGVRNYDITGLVVLVDDDEGLTSDACESIDNDVTQKIALIDRGGCRFDRKVANAQAAGAIGVILANDRCCDPVRMGATPPPVPQPLIGVLSISQADGVTLKAAVASSTVGVTATLFRTVGNDRDGTIDNTIVAHEWGHYIHNRLSGCTATNATQCRGTGEGWGDFLALHMMLSEGDDLDGAYAVAAFSKNDFYYGLRRGPYSADLAKNALSFRHIGPATLPPEPFGGPGNNWQVHNAGEIWASMLFQGYVSLQRQVGTSSTAPTFAQVKRKMADYIVAGLMLTPHNATYLETRDGILAAAMAQNPADGALLAEAFAVRGAGSCAVGPTAGRYSSNNAGITESFEVNANVVFGQVTVDQSIRACDDDGRFDGDERGNLSVRVSNASGVPAPGTVVTVTPSGSDAVSFPQGNTRTLDLGAYQSEDLVFEIAIDPTLTSTHSLALALRVDSPGACQTSRTSTVVQLLNGQELPGSTVSTAEPRTYAWTAVGADSDQVWDRVAFDSTNHVFIGRNVSFVTDTAFESPTLRTSTTAPFIMSFFHIHQFEADEPDGSETNYDGGVIELSLDDGQTWVDSSTIANPGYGGVLSDCCNNPLADRPAFVATSQNYPILTYVELDYGMALAGRDVKVRFRIATDAGTSDVGWLLDVIRFQGITNAPFIHFAPDENECAPELIANAGPDQTVGPSQSVLLDASAASYYGDPIQYSWAQTAGPTVDTATTSATGLTFTAPRLEQETTLTFVVTASDDRAAATDAVDITVRALPAPAPLIANAGADQDVAPAATVVLDGAMSTGEQRFPFTHTWSQTAGPNVAFINDNGVTVAFVAPQLTQAATLTFTLTLDDGTRTSTDTVDINVSALAPLVADAGADQAVDPAESVVLDGSDSTGDATLPHQHSWSQTAGPNVTLLTADAGAGFVAPLVAQPTTLTFQLEVTDGMRTVTDSVDVVVGAVEALVAVAGADQSAQPGESVVLDGTGSNGDLRLPFTYSWSQTGGPAVQLVDPDGATASFVAPADASAATLTFALVVADAVRTATDTVDVQVRALAGLVANAGADQTAGPAAVIVLDGSQSTGDATRTLMHSWSQISGPAVTLTGDSETVSFSTPSLEQAATLTFRLSVTDGIRTATDDVDVEVTPLAPLVAAAGMDTSVSPGQTVVLNGSGSTGDASLPVTLAWAQDSGDAVTFTINRGGIAAFVAPEPEQETRLIFGLTATDGARTSTDAIEITVRAKPAPGPLTAQAGPDITVAAGGAVVLDGSQSTADENATLSLQWAQTAGVDVTFLNDNGPVVAFVAPSPEAESKLTFVLTASDGTMTATDEVVVTVGAAPAEPPEPEDDCSCSTTRRTGEGGGPWTALFGVFGLMVFRRARGSRASAS